MDLGITGTKRMVVTTAESITKELLSGMLQISMDNVQAVEDASMQSANAATIIKDMLTGDMPTLGKTAR
jgi:hypothetical protein